MEPSNDIFHSLGEIRSRLSAPIYSTLLEIQKHRVSKAKQIKWIQNLECLFLPPTVGQKRRHADDGEAIETKPVKMVLERQRINPCEKSQERDYIAVSWVWGPESEEKNACEKYLVRSREDGQHVPSTVRDGILDRVIKYTNFVSYKLFWIDKICIDQNDREELETATQTMDQVYSLSRKSLAIISKQISTKEDLILLMELMEGKHVNSNGGISMVQEVAGKVLKLIEKLTSDSWWKRAWTFQEDYMAKRSMVLLVSHHPSLEELKRSLQIFKKVPGEACINCAEFRTEVSRFCQAYRQTCGSNHEDIEICDQILKRAGKYTILLRENERDGSDVFRKPMSPVILADIGARDITKSWDRLAIVANCCNYDIRLNAKDLSDLQFSQSLALLTQHLLNGEIFNNEPISSPSAIQNIFKFLEHQSLDSFDSPVRAQLTYIKSCRLPEVTIVSGGVQTIGYLWKLGKEIEVKWKSKLPREGYIPLHLEESIERNWLQELANELNHRMYGRGGEMLAKNIMRYLKREESAKNEFADMYMYLMSRAILYAIEDPKKVLRVGSFAGGPEYQKSHCCGIFVCDRTDQDTEHVFTAYSQSRGHTGEIDKHVSLGVKWLNPNMGGIPEVITKKWMNGLYFVRCNEKRTVLFPWLDFLKA